MKKTANIIAYLTALCIMVTSVFKFEHLPGAGIGLCLTGLLLSIYFALFILVKFSEKNEGRILPLHVLAAFSAALIDLGITFKIMHWPGAGVMLTLGFADFALIFIPLYWVRKSKEAHADKFMLIAGALGLVTFALGILFKLQHWPGSTIMLALSPILLFLIYFPKFMLNKAIDADVKYKHLRQSFFVIIIGCLLALYFIKSIEIHQDAQKRIEINVINTDSDRP